MLLGLVGCHRVGKTTLAKAFALNTGAKFIETSIYQWGLEIGLDASSSNLNFDDRMTLQEHLLKRLNQTLDQAALDIDGITDRTPLDLLIYTMINVQAETVSDANFARLQRYVQACFDSTNKHFLAVVAIQPGIVIEESAGKGSTNRAYMEHLNTLVLGFINDERLKISRFYIPRNVLTITRRLSSIKNAVGMAMLRQPIPPFSKDVDPFHLVLASARTPS